MDLPAVFTREPWGLVVVTGRDATSFLQAIVSQDLDGVEVGASVSSLLLQPQGKLDVAFRASRRAASEGEAWWLDTSSADAPRLSEGLARYRIRVDATIEDRTAGTALASVVGVGFDDDRAPADSPLVRCATRWRDTPGYDVLGPTAEVTAWVAASPWRPGTSEELEALRIESRVPSQGVDVDSSTIPQEAFLEADAVSFTKGCFVGQELVCRIDARGHVNRFLRRIAIPGDAVPARGSEVVVGGRVVGAVTSAAAVPGEHRVVALAMLRREVEPPADATIDVDGRPTPVSVLD